MIRVLEPCWRRVSPALRAATRRMRVGVLRKVAAATLVGGGLAAAAIDPAHWRAIAATPVAATITEVRGMSQAWVNSSTRRSTAGSKGTGAERQSEDGTQREYPPFPGGLALAGLRQRHGALGADGGEWEGQTFHIRGETKEEVLQAMSDIRAADVDVITFGRKSIN